MVLSEMRILEAKRDGGVWRINPRSSASGPPSITGLSRRHRRRGFDPWVRRSPGGGNGKPLQYSGEFHGQKSLQTTSLKDHKESDMMKQLSTLK